MTRKFTSPKLFEPPVGRSYANCVFASHGVITDVVHKRQGRLIVWPDEGVFANGIFFFNEKHAGEFEPLWLDPTSASAIRALGYAIKRQDLKNKYREMIAKDRGSFTCIVEMAWKHTRPKAA